MPSSSDSSTVTLKASSRAITSSTRSKLSASRSSPKRASGTTLSAGTCNTSMAHALNLSKVATSVTASSLSELCLFELCSQPHGQAPVDRKYGPGDVSSVVGGEEGDRTRNISGACLTAQRHHRQELLHALFSQASDHIRVDHAGRDN